MLEMDRLDHLVLTVRDIPRTVDFYTRVLGMRPVTFAGGRRALAFGRQKINLHLAGREFEPRAAQPQPGSADLCFITETPLKDAMDHIASCGVELVLPPSPRTGAVGAMQSIYLRDPDENLIEVSNYDPVADGG